MGNSEHSSYRRRGRRRTGPLMSPVREAVPAFGERAVLVVEADPDVQVQMARTLRQQGLRVVGASSGAGALALVSEWNVDLILVSENLPDYTGIDVARQLHHALPTAQVVVVANHVEPNVFAAARAAGAVGCVSKPLEAESVSRFLRAAANNDLPMDKAVAE
jgi:CheY-like chemotaxis protein